MRKLFITRGLPGSGKTTFLDTFGLTPYTVSPDSLRLMMSGPVLRLDGRLGIDQRHDRQVWRQLNETLVERMARGELVVVDATHTTARYYRDYAELARKHRYQLYVIDFANVSLEVCWQRNNQRPAYKQVTRSVMERMYEQLQDCQLPKGYTVLLPEQVADQLTQPPLELDQYRRIHHLGDIQGCYQPLAEYFQRFGLHDDEFYIFVGDLLDRGPDNDKVLAYVCQQLVGRPNVLFIEGNHDLYIWQWLSRQSIRSREFTGRTQPQLERADIDKRAVSNLVRSFRDMVEYTYHGRRVLVTHAGLSTVPDQPVLLASQQYISGVGMYDEVGAVDDAFVAQTADNTYQIHGHRNAQAYPTAYNQRCFNLEGKVEFGGHLRTVQLTPDGFVVTEISNAKPGLQLHPENIALVRSLQRNRLITERQLPDNINSYHFKPQVFYGQKWTEQTMRARGLFVHGLTNEIVIRAYDKFFNIGERPDTQLAALQQRLQFPVTAWVKENGYLGLVGYNAVTDQLVFASKSTTESDFAHWFRQAFVRLYRQHLTAIKQYLSEQQVCLVCEVILPQQDPHIIDYQSDEIVLLDIVRRQAEFARQSEAERRAFAKSIGLTCKQRAAVCHDWAEFCQWYDSVQGMDYHYSQNQSDRPIYIEGFVLEDAAGWQVKLKLDYYSFWKQMRSALAAVVAGKKPRIKPECPDPELARQVIDYMQSLPIEQLANMSIIELRQRWSSQQSQSSTDHRE